MADEACRMCAPGDDDPCCCARTGDPEGPMIDCPVHGVPYRWSIRIDVPATTEWSRVNPAELVGPAARRFVTAVLEDEPEAVCVVERLPGEDGGQ